MVSNTKVVKGTIWAAADRFGNMAVQFAVNLVMARLLMPEAFGVIGILQIFIAVSQTLVDAGFGTALIQKKEPTDTDYSTVFWVSLGLSAIFYAILFLAAPPISVWLKMPILSPVLRALGVMVILIVPVSVQNNRLRKQLMFGKLAFCNIVSMLIAGAAGIVAAVKGCGAWALVTMMTTNYFMQAVTLTIASRWVPKMKASRESVKELFSFGGYMLAASVLQEICKNLQGIIIGKRFNATIMGYYSQAQKLDMVCSYSLPQVIVQVMYPVYSSLQDEKDKLAKMLDSNVRVIAALIFPLMVLMMILAPWLIDALYGAKWSASVPYFQVLCVGGMFVCLQNINFYAVAACGKSRTLFVWSFYKWGFLLAGLLIGMLMGMYGILWAMVLSNINIFIVNAMLASRHIGYRVRTQLLTLCPIFASTLIAGGMARISGMTSGMHPVYEGAVFAALYIGITAIVSPPLLKQIMAVISKLWKHEGGDKP